MCKTPGYLFSMNYNAIFVSIFHSIINPLTLSKQYTLSVFSTTEITLPVVREKTCVILPQSAEVNWVQSTGLEFQLSSELYFRFDPVIFMNNYDRSLQYPENWTVKVDLPDKLLYEVCSLGGGGGGEGLGDHLMILLPRLSAFQPNYVVEHFKRIKLFFEKDGRTY